MNVLTNHLKHTAALVLCGATLALPAMAQQTQQPDPNSAPPAAQTQAPPQNGGGGHHGGGKPDQRLSMMQSQLSLTPDQTDKVKAIMEDGRGQMKAVREDTTLSQEDRRSKSAGLMKSENDKIKDVLTPDQKVKYEAMVKQQREQMKARRANGNGDGPPPAPATPPQQ